MQISNWDEKDYTLIDAENGNRLEKWGENILIRPDPLVIWKDKNRSMLWEKATAQYIRSSTGKNGKEGEWKFLKNKKFTETIIKYSPLELSFVIKPTSFKHTGLFPEQASNWSFCNNLIKNTKREINVLNLFAYTGGATLACANAGASVCHLDAVKGMVDWARINAEKSGLKDKKIRYITDDARKFLQKELRRGHRYDAVILDPPSYGRGTSGEMWQYEADIYELMNLVSEVLSEKPLFVLLNSYSTGISPAVILYLFHKTIGKKLPGAKFTADEIGLPVKHTGLIFPCGNSGYAIFE